MRSHQLPSGLLRSSPGLDVAAIFILVLVCGLATTSTTAPPTTTGRPTPSAAEVLMDLLCCPVVADCRLNALSFAAI